MGTKKYIKNIIKKVINNEREVRIAFIAPTALLVSSVYELTNSDCLYFK